MNKLINFITALLLAKTPFSVSYDGDVVATVTISEPATEDAHFISPQPIVADVPIAVRIDIGDETTILSWMYEFHLLEDTRASTPLPKLEC